MTDTRQPFEQQPIQGSAAPYSPGQNHGYPPPAGMDGYGRQQAPSIPPQGQWTHPSQGPWAPQHGGWGPPPQPTPQKNALAMPTLVLGIVTLGLSPLPFLNQVGILVGIVGAGLGIAALVIGVRRHVRAVMAAIGLALSVLGIISAVAFTSAFVNSLNSIGASTSSSGPAVPAQSVGGSEESAAVTSYTLSITGSASKSSIGWSVDGSSGSVGQSTKVPWTKVMTIGSDSWHSATLYANTYPGTPGDLTCTITDQTGRVLDTKSAASQGGDYGSASVNCSAFGS